MVNAYPRTLKDALTLRAEGRRPMGGGTDLMVRFRSAAGVLPRFQQSLVFLRGVDELKNLEERGDLIAIGAGVTLRELCESPLIPVVFKNIMGQMASFAIRSEATLAGNIGNASPAADSLPFLICRNASLVLTGQRGDRTVSVADFITGPGKTLLADDELIREILLPREEFTLSFHKKVGGRRSDAISKLSFLGEARREGNNLFDLRIAFGSVAPRIIRSEEGEALAREVFSRGGNTKDIEGFYEKLITPIDDQRSTAEYRKTVSLNLLRRFMEKLREQ
ncbi:MAG: FAD binding domain-containing protein [Spirochaetales bacterium]|nr:FAD binding domain-containing protein [Spirochaetales bacterium]